MSTRITSAILSLLLLLAFTGCEQEPGVSSEQAEEAFLVAFGSAYVGSMAAQFEQPLPGMTLDAESGTITFEEFDVSELQTQYETLSGEVTSTEESANADFTLTGGPVETISFDLSADQMSAESGIQTTVTVNGEETEIDIQPDEAAR